MSWLREADAEPIPGYCLIEPIGSGGFGEVWKCTAPGGILKAIKFVYGNLNSDDVDAIRAEQEQKALQRVKDVRHPFVLSMDRIEIVGGELAIVMELADKSLHDLMTEYHTKGLRGIPRHDAIRYLLDAAEGLDHLIEKHNLQHLDVKPRNLFLIGDRVKVADFGLAKQVERPSGAGVLGGMSPVYGAPETFEGKISKQSDQYSLAVVYCEILTGKRPFSGKNIRQLALQHMNDPPDLAMLPDADRAIVAQALAKDPTKRFGTCQAFIRALSPNVVQTLDSIDLDADMIGFGNRPLQDEDGPPTARITFDDYEDESAATTSVPNRLVNHPQTSAHSQAATRVQRTDDDELPLGFEPQPQSAAPSANGESAVNLGDSPSGPSPELTASHLSRGLLRPTIFLGVGAFGRRALVEIRCRILDRFGDPEQIPSYRFLYVDSDPEAIDQASTGTPEVALNYSETLSMPLQPVINYRRKMIEHLNLWLPKEKLHSIPRSLQPQGSRALGRLAFVDNFPRFQARLRRELQIAVLPDSIEQSVQQTGMSRGKETPRVFVFASGCGGSAGMLVDLGYALRRLLRQLTYSDATVTLYNFSGSPRDPSSSRLELANAYATLTELNHYRSAENVFDAQLGPDGPHISDNGPPFDAIYLVCSPERTPDSVRDTVAHLATYVTQDVTSHLGATLERSRKAARLNESPAFRSFGTFTAWFPRGLLLRLAARKAVARLIEVWQAAVLPKSLDMIEKHCNAVLADPGLRWESLSVELNRAATTSLGTPIAATETFLEQIEKEAVSHGAIENPGTWSAQMYERVKRWAGPGTGRELEAHWKKSQFYKNLSAASQQLGEQWDEYLSGQLRDLVRLPGHRLATVEAGQRRVVQFCDKAIRVQWEAVEKHYQSMKKLREEVESAQLACQGGVKMLFGGTNRTLRNFLELLKQFARQRISQDVLEAGVQFFMTLRGRFEDRIRDLGFARHRLKHLRQVLSASPGRIASSQSRLADHTATGLEINDPFWDAVQGTATVQIVLPAGITDLEKSADQFVQSLRPEHWLSLDEFLQAEVLAPLGDLHIACTAGAEVANYFGRPLVEQAAWHLGTILPITDVAQVEFSAAEAQNVNLADRIGAFASAASPLIHGGVTDLTYFLVPETESGQAFGRTAISTQPNVHIVPVENPIELTVLREQPKVSDEMLDELFGAARTVYQEVVGVPTLSPHSRFDVNDWRHLDRNGVVK